MASVLKPSLLRPTLSLLVVSVFCAVCSAGLAAEQTNGQTSAPAKAAEWIKKLNSPEYKQRAEATRELHKLGKPAIEVIARAAETDDLEIAARCVTILQSFYKSGDAATKSAAAAALKRLESCRHATVAKRAADATRKPKPVSVTNPVGNRLIVLGGLNRAQPVQIQQQIVQRLANRARQRVAPRQISREAKAKDNGKTIYIKETMLPKREIVVKVTEKVGGRDKTTEYKARTSAELRRKQPKAYALYKKHIRDARVRFQIGNVRPVRAAAVVQRAAANPPAANPPPPVVQGFGGGGIGIRISSRTVNGQREMTINDGDRTIRINDENGQNIRMRVTETVAGKKKTTEYKAKDSAELKKKHPKAAELYEKYTKRGRPGLNRIIRNRFGRLPNFPNPPQIPIQVAPFGRPGGAKAQTAKKEIEKANDLLAKAMDKLKKLAAGKNAKPEDLKKVAEEIQFARDALERAHTAIK